MGALKRLLLGPDGRLRGFISAVIFYVAGTWVVFPLLAWPADHFAEILHPTPGLSAGNIAVGELRNLIVAFICTGVFALYERRRVDSYGLPIARALGRQTFEGATAGVVEAALVAAGMLALGGMRIAGLAGDGSGIAPSGLAWLGACIANGFGEEFFYRGYLQQTLWKSIGFWPASIVIALVFAADHYFYKAGENIWDVISLVWLSLLISWSVRRTGALWWGVGLHAGFNYMQLFVIGTPNGSVIPAGRLLNSSFPGPAWLTGGVLGTEASLLMYPVLALLSVYVWRRYRGDYTPDTA